MTGVPPPSAAPLACDPYARHVVARLLDFFADTSPWPRRLWEVSSVLALREAVEAGDWVRTRVLSSGALSWYLRALERQLGPDRGLGDKAPSAERLARAIATHLLGCGHSSGQLHRWARELPRPQQEGGRRSSRCCFIPATRPMSRTAGRWRPIGSPRWSPVPGRAPNSRLCPTG